MSRAHWPVAGVLGVIPEVSLKVLPTAPAQVTLSHQMDQQQALRWLNGLTRQPLPVNASCWHDGLCCCGLRVAKAAVEAARSKLGGDRQDDATASASWNAAARPAAPLLRGRQGSRRAALAPVGAGRDACAVAAGRDADRMGGAQRRLRSRATAAELRAAAQAGGHATFVPWCGRR